MKKRNLSAKKKIHNFYLDKLKNPRIKKIYLKFEESLEKYNLSKFSIAVSGGTDSMALTFLAKCHSIKKQIDYLYYTVDHKLRNASTNEATQTKQELKKFGIFCEILTWRNDKNFSNLQAKARENRYDLIFQKSLKNRVNLVLTAHQKNDLYENFFIRLSRGSGLKGLSSFGETIKEKEHGIQTRLMPINVMGSMLRQFDFHRNRILLSEAMPEEQRLFQLCSQVALVISQPQLDTIISESGIDNIDSKNLLKMTLSNYFAGCLMMPYDSFLNAAIESKYDLEQLTNRFSASFEQICHRLTTLNKPNA